MKKEQESKQEDKLEEQEESELEEEIEEAEQELDEEKFVEFLSPSAEASQTSLGQVGIATELRATDLEQDLSQNQINNGNKEEKDEFKYNISSNQEEGPKYITSETEIERAVMPTHTDIMSLGKEQNLLFHELGFTASPTAKIGESEGVEKYVLPNKVDSNKLGKENIFEKPEVKYKSSM